MRTWNDYKEHVAAADPEIAKDIREAEAMSAIVKAMVEQRNAMGLSQRELAARCGIPQSSVARIESFKTMPNLDTLLKIFQQLGLKLTISAADSSCHLPHTKTAPAAALCSAGAVRLFFGVQMQEVLTS